MNRDSLLHLAARRSDALNRHDLATLTALYAADCVVDSPLAAGTVHGRQAVAKVHQAFFEAFPDLTFTQEQVLVDGDQLVIVGTLAGSYNGGFMGLPPTGKPFRVPAVVVCRIAGGEIAAERRVYDLTGMLVQAGLLKARPA
jgi:steroid delta-isomerase-like uncharacterized protein